MFQLSVFGRISRVGRSLRVAPVAIALTGVVGLSLGTILFSSGAPAAHAASASGFYYQRGYYLDDGWFCYGWSDGAYHCTQSFHKERKPDSGYISDNPAWVPNGLDSMVTSSTNTTTNSSAPSTTSQQPAPVTSAPVASGGSVVSMIDSVFGPYAGEALSVASCESGYNPGAYNPISVGGSHAEGVFQILYPSTWDGTSYAGSSPYNASANINAAYQIFARDGYSWREWVCR